MSSKLLPVLSDGFLSLESVLGPDPLGVDELTLPWLNVTIQVRNQLVLFMAHSRPEVGDAHICLLGPSAQQREGKNNVKQ